MSTTEAEFKSKAARLLALKSMAKREPRPEGRSTTEIVGMVVDKVRREVGGGSNQGLGVVPTNTKLALAARYLAQDHGIVIDPGSITVDRVSQGEMDDFQMLRIVLAGAIDGQSDTSTPSSPTGPDPAEVQALLEVTGKDADDIADLIGSPKDAATTLVSSQMTLDEFAEKDAVKVRAILVRSGKLKVAAPATSQPAPMSPQEISLAFHQKASRNSNGEGRLTDAALHWSLAQCVRRYSYGPNPKYRYSVKLKNNGILEVIEPTSKLNARYDIGPETQNEDRSMELQLGMALLDMSGLIEAEFRKGKENPNALALYKLFSTIRGLVMEQCNQENAKGLVPILNNIRP